MQSKSYSKIKPDHLPGFALANKFLMRFMKYKYHVPHEITISNTIKTHRLTMFVNSTYGTSSYLNNKFNGYVLCAWFDRYSKIKDKNIDKLLKHIPSYYHEILKYYLKSLDDVYKFIQKYHISPNFKDYSTCYELIQGLVQRYRYYKDLCLELKNEIIKEMSHPLQFKYSKNKFAKDLTTGQLLPIYPHRQGQYFYRFQTKYHKGHPPHQVEILAPIHDF